MAGAASLAQIEPPTGIAEGWDAADALAEGWSQERALSLVAARAPIGWAETPTPIPMPSVAAPALAADDGGKRGPGRPPWHDTLLALTAEFELWHTRRR